MSTPAGDDGRGARVIGQCPECGWEPRSRLSAPSEGRHWTVRVPAVFLLLGVAVLALWFWLDAENRTLSSGTPGARIVSPEYTVEDVARIVDNRDGAAAVELVDAILASTPSPWSFKLDPGDRSIDVRFSNTNMPRAARWRVGWPAPWVSVARYWNYEDAVRREGFLPAATDRSLAPLSNRHTRPVHPQRVPPRPWLSIEQGEILVRPPPERTGGVETNVFITPAAMASVAVGALLLWWLAGLAHRCVRGRKAPDRSVVRRRWRRRGALIGALIVILFGVLEAERTEDPLFAMSRLRQAGSPPGLVYFERSDYVRLPWLRSEIEAHRDDRDFALTLAEVVLTSTIENDEGRYLAAATDSECLLDDASSLAVAKGFELLILGKQRFLRRPDFGTVEHVAPPAGVRVAARGAQIGVWYMTGDPARPTHHLYVMLDRAAIVVFMLWAAWWLPRAVCVGVWRKRGGKRRAQGLCPQCGYEIGGVRP
ncbi:MAG TPA: hypothetical protein PLU35_00125 [Phycisphaerales bacterium]|nr:hypothetical protein [Phycisphaerales bacterium]